MYTCVQVKVCEGCGMLWFREESKGEVYCSKCVRKLADFPSPGSRKLRGRKSGKASAGATATDASEPMAPVSAGCE